MFFSLKPLADEEHVVVGNWSFVACEAGQKLPKQGLLLPLLPLADEEHVATPCNFQPATVWSELV